MRHPTRRAPWALCLSVLLAALLTVLPTACEPAPAPAPGGGQGAPAAGGPDSPAPDAPEPPGSPASPDPLEAAETAARTAASQLGSRLVRELFAAIEAGGGKYEAAVDACAGMAQRITEEEAEKAGLRIRRIALRNRNPDNAPDAWERKVLEEWERTGEYRAGHSEVVSVEGGGRELRRMQPIVLMKVCENCHGPKESIPDAVEETIAKHYPGDRAKDFRAGDLRGAFSMRVALPAAKQAKE